MLTANVVSEPAVIHDYLYTCKGTLPDGKVFDEIRVLPRPVSRTDALAIEAVLIKEQGFP